MMKLDTEEVQRVTREMNRYLEGTTIEELMMIRRKRFCCKVGCMKRIDSVNFL